MQWLGDYTEDETLYFLWSTNDGSGASITRATDGTVSVYKDNGVSQSVAGVVDVEDFDGLTGIHACTIDLSTDVFYAVGADYAVVLSAATIDGQTVNAVLAHFSIENRFAEVDVTKWLGTAAATPTVAGVPEVDATHIAGVAVSTTTAQLGVNIVQISEDATAADNLELQYDTTGLEGDTFPSTQAQLNNIALTGAAVNTPAIDSPDGFNITWGENEANDEDSTHAADGTYHDIEAQNDGGTEKIDVYYEFTIGGDGVPTSAAWEGYLSKGGGAAKNLTVQAYNWGGTAWEQIGSVVSSTTNITETFTLFTTHVGTGANLGLVRIRFLTGGVALSATTLLKTDQIFVSYAIVSRSVGYADGAIWIDTNASNTNTNTESYVDGTADNPVSTWAAALTLSGQLNIIRFRIKNGSSITLTGNSDNYTLQGENWTLALGGQSIARIHVNGADVSGTGTGATKPKFDDCHIGTVTLPPSHLTFCGLEATFTIGTAGTFFFDRCHSGVAGTSTPVLDFGGALNASNVNIRGYSGGIDIRNMGAGSGSYNMSLEGHGQLIINANCSATSTIAIRGHFTKTNNASGMTISEDARYDVDQINAQVDDALDTAIPGSPTADSINQRITAIDDLTQASGDGDLAAMTTHLVDIKGTSFVKDTDSLVDLAHTGADGDTLETLSDQIDAIPGVGSGAITFVYTLTNSVNSDPIVDANVWATSDQAGNNTLASSETDSNGQVTFYLNAGTVYFWRQKAGWNFDNPDTETVA